MSIFLVEVALSSVFYIFFFFFNDTATTEIYTLSLHDALPISPPAWPPGHHHGRARRGERSEEHTSELQSRVDLVCRLLLEKKKRVGGYSCATDDQKDAGTGGGGESAC